MEIFRLFLFLLKCMSICTCICTCVYIYMFIFTLWIAFIIWILGKINTTFRMAINKKIKHNQNKFNPYFLDYYIEVLNFIWLLFSNFFFLLFSFTEMKAYTSEKNKLKKCDHVHVTKGDYWVSIHGNIQKQFEHNPGQLALGAVLKKRGLKQTTPRDHLQPQPLHNPAFRCQTMVLFLHVTLMVPFGCVYACVYGCVKDVCICMYLILSRTNNFSYLEEFIFI